MNERRDDIVEEGGTVEHWDPLEPRDRTDASPVERAFRKILEALKEIFRSFGKGKNSNDAETIDAWEPIGGKPR